MPIVARLEQSISKWQTDGAASSFASARRLSLAPYRHATCLQFTLEGEPTSKTPRVPPAQSPGINAMHQHEIAAVSSKPSPANSAGLDAFVHDFVDSLVSEVKSELMAEAQGTAAQRSSHADASAVQSSLPFTEGSSAAVSPSPHKAQLAAAKGTPHKGSVTRGQSGGQSSVKRLSHRPVSAASHAHAESSQAQPESQGDASIFEAHPIQSQPKAQDTAQTLAQPEPQELASQSDRAAGNGQAGAKVTVAANSQAGTAEEAEAEQPDTVSLVHDLVQELLGAVTRHAQTSKVMADLAAQQLNAAWCPSHTTRFAIDMCLTHTAHVSDPYSPCASLHA